MLLLLFTFNNLKGQTNRNEYIKNEYLSGILNNSYSEEYKKRKIPKFIYSYMNNICERKFSLKKKHPFHILDGNTREFCYMAFINDYILIYYDHVTHAHLLTFKVSNGKDIVEFKNFITGGKLEEFDLGIEELRRRIYYEEIKEINILSEHEKCKF